MMPVAAAKNWTLVARTITELVQMTRTICNNGNGQVRDVTLMLWFDGVVKTVHFDEAMLRKVLALLAR